MGCPSIQHFDRPCNLTWCRSPSASGVQEHCAMRYEQLGKLEERAMTGIGIDDELSLRDSLRKIVGIDCRNHDVMITVHDERRLPDIVELRVSFPAHLAPSNDCRSLSGHGLRCARPIGVLLAEMPPLPKRFAGSLARRRGTEKEVEKGVERTLAGLGVR